jgi:hypothetical protein
MYNVPEFLTRGGRIGELIRSVNWSATPLGDPETWPLALRTTLALILNTPFPMYIAWGPEFIQFYNDKFCPIIGPAKHSDALGNTASITFQEAWEVIHPMFKKVLSGEPVCF